MAFNSEFIPIALDDLHREAAIRKTEGWRFIQTHAVKADDGIDLFYSFMKDGKVESLCVRGVRKDQPVPSITDLFLAAFVFENEARELFGVDMRDIAIDFGGAMYTLAESEPMTFISPEQKAARDKAKKAAEAKKAKADGAEQAPAPAPAKRIFVMTPERRARLDAKLATMSPEKVAKVEAALKARAAEAEAAALGQGSPESQNESQDSHATHSEDEKTSPAASQQSGSKDSPATHSDTALDAQLATMDPAKAEKVRAALAGKTASANNAQAPAAEKPKAPAAEEPQAPREADGQLEQLINMMDDAKAQIVRKAFQIKEGE